MNPFVHEQSEPAGSARTRTKGDAKAMMHALLCRVDRNTQVLLPDADDPVLELRLLVYHSLVMELAIRPLFVFAFWIEQRLNLFLHIPVLLPKLDLTCHQG